MAGSPHALMEMGPPTKRVSVKTHITIALHSPGLFTKSGPSPPIIKGGPYINIWKCINTHIN